MDRGWGENSEGVIILSGGLGLRFGGIDKAFVHLAGRPLIEHMIEFARGVSREIVIVSNHPARYAGYNVSTVSDEIRGAGPLSGISAGLMHSRRDINLVIGCDMPFIEKPLVDHMLNLNSEGDAVVPRVGRFIEPLCSVYNKSCLPAVQSALAEDRFKISEVLSGLDVTYVEEDTLRQFDPSLASFHNINTLDDLILAEEMIRRESEDHEGKDSTIRGRQGRQDR